MGSNDRRIVITITTENDWRESFASDTELPISEWTHVSIRCDARQRQVRIFVNGAPDAEHHLSSPTKPNPHPFYIGQPPEGVMKVSRPSIDGCQALLRDVRFFTRAITDVEIGMLYSHFAPVNRSQRLAPLASPLPSPILVRESELDTFLKAGNKGWGMETLAQLVELVVGICDETKQDPLTIDSDAIVVSREDLDRFPAIRHLSPSDMRILFSAIRLFNRQLTVVLPLVDFSQTHLSWSLASSVCKLTGPPIFIPSSPLAIST